MSENQDQDLVKIQILSDYYQPKFNYKASIVAGIIVGLLLASIGIYFQLGFIAFYLWLVAVFGALIWYSHIIFNGYHSDLKNIDSPFKRIQNGETLESIDELRTKFATRKGEKKT